MKTHLVVLGLSVAFAATACNNTDSKEGSPNAAGSASKAAGATSAAAAAGAQLGPSSLEVTWTGKFDTTDGPGQEYPLMRVVNKDATRPLTYYQGYFYFYDRDKKQIGREFRDRYQLSIKPGQSSDIGAGPRKSELPKGTEFIEFVVSGANFGSETDKFRITTPPLETRPLGG